MGQTLKIHDRRAKDLLKAGEYAAIEVDDPYEAGGKIVTTRQLRNDPLARLHTRSQIDEAQYCAGREYQRIWERTECGARAIDPTKEKVDGGMLPEALKASRMAAFDKLADADKELGKQASRIIYDVLVRGLTIELLIAERGLSGQWQMRIYGKKFRDGLDRLARHFGFSNGENHESSSGSDHNHY
jgi:hypothetical protein